MENQKVINVNEDGSVEVTKPESNFTKIKAGVKKHGKKIAIIVGAVIVGTLGFMLGRRSIDECCDVDYDNIDFTFMPPEDESSEEETAE